MKSKILFQRAQQHLVGGVNSPVRSFRGVGGSPIFFARGEGAYLIDVDEKNYIDYVGSWGPLILGHCHPKVTQAVMEAVHQGLTFGAPNERELILAEKINSFVPSMAMVRIVNSGTEAAMSAIRLARGFTGRNKIIKFNGCYHGHHDSLLVNAGSGVLTLGIPSCPGVPAAFTEHTLVAEFNDLASVEALVGVHGKDLAGIIVEPVAGNMGCVPPTAEFLPGLREICDRHDAVLIFDEVMTGLRVAQGGAQAYYGVTPDLTILGKIIGGGLPVGAFGGRQDIMACLAPMGMVYQAGTLSGNPVAMAAGIATLNELSAPDFYIKLTHTTEELAVGLTRLAKQYQLPMIVTQVGGMLSVFFTDQVMITDFAALQRCNTQLFNQFFHGMLAQGIYLPPSAYESWFVSGMHTSTEITATLAAVNAVFAKLLAMAESNKFDLREYVQR